MADEDVVTLSTGFAIAWVRKGEILFMPFQIVMTSGVTSMIG